MKIHSQKGFAPIILLIIGVLAIGGVAFAVKKNSDNKAEKVKVADEAQVTATSTNRTVHVTLAEQNNSGQSGKAVITEVNGKAKVIVNIPGKPGTEAQPAHIHLSSCATIGAVKYPLTSITNGASQTTLDVSLDQLLAQLPLSINVHKSSTEASVYVACGDLSTSTQKTTEKATTTPKVKSNNGTTSVDTKVKVDTTI